MHRYNPASIKVKVYEMPHEPDRFSARGGPNTGDHVDILGRQSLNDMILRVAAGRGDDIENNVVSEIMTYAGRVKIREEKEWENVVTEVDEMIKETITEEVSDGQEILKHVNEKVIEGHVEGVAEVVRKMIEERIKDEL